MVRPPAARRPINRIYHALIPAANEEVGHCAQDSLPDVATIVSAVSQKVLFR